MSAEQARYITIEPSHDNLPTFPITVLQEPLP
jgi:hypothetical protein